MSHIDPFEQRFLKDLESVFGDRVEDVHGRVRESLFILYGLAFAGGRDTGVRSNDSNRKAFVMGYDMGVTDVKKEMVRSPRVLAEELFSVINLEVFEE